MKLNEFEMIYFKLYMKLIGWYSPFLTDYAAYIKETSLILRKNYSKDEKRILKTQVMHYLLVAISVKVIHHLSFKPFSSFKKKLLNKEAKYIA